MILEGTVVATDGTTLRVVKAGTVQALEQQAVGGESLVRSVPPAGDWRWDFVAGAWVPNPPPPPTLQEVKAAAWERIKTERAAREFGTFTWDGSVFDADDTSQRRIQGAAQLATLAQAAGQPFSIDWTLADNTVRTLSGADMIAVGMALGTHVVTQHAIARSLRAAITAATTVEQLDSITWPE